MTPPSWRARAKYKAVKKKARRARTRFENTRQKKEDKALFESLTMADIRAWWRTYD